MFEIRNGKPRIMVIAGGNADVLQCRRSGPFVRKLQFPAGEGAWVGYRSREIVRVLGPCCGRGTPQVIEGRRITRILVIRCVSLDRVPLGVFLYNFPKSIRIGLDTIGYPPCSSTEFISSILSDFPWESGYGRGDVESSPSLWVRSDADRLLTVEVAL